MNLALCLLLAASGAWAQTYVLTGALQGSDKHSHRLEPFFVPAGTRRITVSFSHAVQPPESVIDLGIFDPQMRFRGWSGSNKSTFTLSEVDATPSFWPGLLPAGTWYLSLGVANARPTTHDTYAAKVYLSPSLELTPASGLGPAVLRREPGWYRGDLHSHTGHSDGTCASLGGNRVPCPEFKALQAAAARGLQFLAITDHNTNSAEPSLLRWQPYFDTLLLLRGRELTTYNGHLNMFGRSDFVDFRVGPGGTTLPRMLEAVHRAGGIVGINHPQSPGGEKCGGCAWEYEPKDYSGLVDTLEIVNGQTLGVEFWEKELAKGRRLAAIGGSDDHHSGEDPTGLGHPTTVVYARELSEAAILEGLKAGRSYVRLLSIEGPEAILEAESGTQKAMLGDTLQAPAGAAVVFRVKIAEADGSVAQIVADGKPVKLLDQPKARGADDRKEFRVVSDGGKHWYRLELRRPDGALEVLTNPIYLNFPL